MRCGSKVLLRELVEASFAAKHGLPSFHLQASVQRAREGALLKGKAVYWPRAGETERQELKVRVIFARRDAFWRCWWKLRRAGF